MNLRKRSRLPLVRMEQPLLRREKGGAGSGSIWGNWGGFGIGGLLERVKMILGLGHVHERLTWYGCFLSDQIDDEIYWADILDRQGFEQGMKASDDASKCYSRGRRYLLLFDPDARVS
jgi:hypothetical protein